MKNLKNKFKENEWAMVKLKESGTTLTWYELACLFNIRPEGDYNQRMKSANDLWRKYYKSQTSQLVLDLEKEKEIIVPKRLYFDIETSYNIVSAFSAGYNKSINYTDILEERKIISVAYKWEGEESVYVLHWEDKCDKKLLEDFIPILNSADEIVGHNIDRFDIKFLRTRALFHRIPMLPKYPTTDTLKIARRYFMLNSNRLDYIAKLLGLEGKKSHEGINLWHRVIRGEEDALEEMLEYNVQDVFTTEDVYKGLANYATPTVNHAVINSKKEDTCPECGSEEIKLEKTIYNKTGNKTRLMSCNCGCQFTLSNKKYEGIINKI